MLNGLFTQALLAARYKENNPRSKSFYAKITHLFFELFRLSQSNANERE